MEQTIPVVQQANQELQRIVEAAFNDVPALYANGFVNGLGMADAYLILQANGRSLAVVNLSLPVAKTLGQSLLELVEGYEQATGQVVTTLEQLQQV